MVLQVVAEVDVPQRIFAAEARAEAALERASAAEAAQAALQQELVRRRSEVQRQGAALQQARRGAAQLEGAGRAEAAHWAARAANNWELAGAAAAVGDAARQQASGLARVPLGHLHSGLHS